MPVQVPLNRAPTFWNRVVKTDYCWEWQGSVSHNGYGRFGTRMAGGVQVRTPAHRYSLALVGVEVPDGHVVDHLCRNRRCVRPDHLEIVTPRVNILRGESASAENAVKEACDWGHEFTPENTYRRPDRVARQCRACVRRRGIEYRQRKAARRA